MTLFGLLPIIVLFLFLLGSVFWLWTLVDCIKNRSLNDNERVIWVLVVLFLHFVGALLYLLIARSKPAGGTPPALR